MITEPILRVVLINPQIPPNTGNIARTCAATKTELHLVGPLGFEISDRYLKRAGLDYWPHVSLHFHRDLSAFQQVQQLEGGRCLGFTVRGRQCYSQFSYQAEDWLIYGSESQGLPVEFLQTCDESLYIPIAEPAVRSLNLSVSVAITLFEAYRQLGHW
jgi:tRNA (cytidine/uridine-2'-O-)-methyltransferase